MKKLKSKPRPRSKPKPPSRRSTHTSHERASGRPWDDSYKNGPAPWDIGAPQPAVIRAIEKGAFAGAREILDAGCGTGESSLYLGSRGHKVFAFDLAKTAIAMARKKAAVRRLTKAVKFTVANALHLPQSLRRRKFDAILDCALFHTFDAPERAQYAASLAQVAKPGAFLYILCFSDKGPNLGPHPVSQAKIRAALNSNSGWHIVSIAAARISTIFRGPDALPAWWVEVKRK